MATINPVTLQDDTPQGELLRAHEDHVSPHLNFFGMLANSPAAFNAYLSAASGLEKGVLSDELSIQIGLTVSAEIGSPYWINAHKTIAEKHGVSPYESELAVSGISSDRRTGLILAFVRKIIQSYGNVKRSEIELLRAQGVTDEEILEIIGNTCLNIAGGMFNQVAGTEIEGDA